MKLAVSTQDLADLIRKDSDPVQHLPIELCYEAEYATLPPEVQKLYTFDDETNAYKLSEEQWLNCRRHGEYFGNPKDPRYIDVTIGGSDLSALFDGSELSKRLKLYDGQHGSPYKTAIELFYEKTDQELPMKEDKPEEVFFTGHAVEPVVRKYFERVYSKDHPNDTVKVINDPHMYQCGRRDKKGNLLFPYMLCDLDGIVEINGIRGILECKTCTFKSEDFHLWKNGIVPLKYYLQTCWYMACMNYPYAYIACTTGLSPSDLVYIYIERNLAIEDEILKMADEFIKCVRTGKEPEVSGQNIDRVYTFWRMKMGPFDPEAKPVSLDESVLGAVQKIITINTEIEATQQRIKGLEEERKQLLVSKIFPAFGDANYGTVNVDEESWYTIKLKNAPSRVPIDTARLKADHPDIYSKYLKPEPSFNTTLFKKEQKELTKQYLDTSGDKKLTETKLNYCEIELKEKKR